MNKKYIVFALTIALLGTFFFSCTKKEETDSDILYYTCGMHPSVKVTPEEYKKGTTNCPICNMGLVPVHKASEAHEEEGDMPILTLSKRSEKLAGVKTVEVKYHHLVKEIITVGKVDYDERKIAYVSAWVSGRIDKLFVDFTGIEVKKGQPMALLYSPNLVSTQEEYILALENLENVKDSKSSEVMESAESLIESTKNRLILWGIPEEEIKRLETERKTSVHMTIYSPISGTVIKKEALEGKYFKEGAPLYTVADLSHLWMVADIYEYEMSFIKLGQKVEVISPSYPGEVFHGKITFIDPVLHPQTRSVKIRADFSNTQRKLKPEMFVSAKIKISIGHKLAIPKSAVLDTGIRKLVYVKHGEGKYMAHEVVLGPESSGFFPVIKGLKEGDIVVTSANFLIDSQSELTGQAAGAYGGALIKEGKEEPSTSHRH